MQKLVLDYVLLPYWVGNHPTGNLRHILYNTVRAMNMRPDQPAVPYSRIMRKPASVEASMEASMEASIEASIEATTSGPV